MNRNFIGRSLERCTVETPIPAPLLRRRFFMKEIPDRAELSVCGLGFYRLFLNGQEITKGALAPYISNPDDICYFDTYNILPFLRNGENVLGLILGNGFQNPFGGEVWNFHRVAWIGAPRVALECSAWCGENQILYFEADEEFSTHDSPIRFDELRLGEAYDAACEMPGWNLPDFDDSAWSPAVRLEAPGGELRPCLAEPIRIRCERKPVSVTREGDAFLYDFGINSAGSFRLRLNARAGQTVTLHFGECLKDGRFDNSNLKFSQCTLYEKWTQKCIYTAKGEGTELYEPSFTYFGYRYVLVEGITEAQATDDLLTYLVMHSDLPAIGGFSCSDKTANTLFRMAQNADLSNFYYFPTDCPHREKNGWTGDASMSADHMLLLYGAEQSLCQWLDNIRKSQADSGALPGIVPTGGWGFDWGNGPAWDSVLFNLPYRIWKLRGNTEVILENAHAMVRYLDYILTRRNCDGTVAIGLGDWVPTGKQDASAYDAPLVLTDSIMVMDMARKAAEMLCAVGYTHQAEFANNIFHDMRRTIRDVLFDHSTATLAGSCQTSQAMGLYYGVFEDTERHQAFERLMDFIHAKQGNFDCGFLGLHCIFHVLSEFGESELAYRMITQKEYPSYGCMIARGETAMVEAIRPETMDCGSHNHHFLCDFTRWLMSSVAGLHVIDSRTVEIKPSYISTLNYAEAYHDLPAGRVSVRWDRLPNGEIKLSVQCPENVRLINVTHDCNSSCLKRQCM